VSFALARAALDCYEQYKNARPLGGEVSAPPSGEPLPPDVAQLLQDVGLLDAGGDGRDGSAPPVRRAHEVRTRDDEQLTNYEMIKNAVRSLFHSHRRRVLEVLLDTIIEVRHQRRLAALELEPDVPAADGAAEDPSRGLALVAESQIKAVRDFVQFYRTFNAKSQQPDAFLAGLRYALQECRSQQQYVLVWTVPTAGLIEGSALVDEVSYMRHAVDLLVHGFHCAPLPVASDWPNRFVGPQECGWQFAANMSDRRISKVLSLLPQATGNVSNYGAVAATEEHRVNVDGSLDGDRPTFVEQYCLVL